MNFLKISLSFALLLVSASLQAQINFHTGDWKTLLADAKKQNKPFFVDFYAVWCGPCKMMSKNTFTDKKVSDFVNAKMLANKVDCEKGEGVGLANQYKIEAYPTVIFFDPNGNVLGTEVGYQDANQFLETIKKYYEKWGGKAQGNIGNTENVVEEKEPGIQFVKGTWADLLAQAKKTGKPFFVDYYATWCGPCKMMSNNTFKNDEIGKIVNANWVAYKLDCEKGEGPNLAAKAKITAYPTLVFYDSQGNEIGRKMGYMDPAGFKPVLEEMLQKAPKTKPVKGGDKSGNPSGANFNDFMKEKEMVMNPLEERVFSALGQENFLAKTKELAKTKDDFAYEDLELEITKKLGKKACMLYNFVFWTEMKKYDRAKEWMNNLANNNPDAEQLHYAAWLFLKHEQFGPEVFRWVNESIRLKVVPETYETKAALQFLANRNEDGLETIKSALKIKEEPRFEMLKKVFENQPALGKK